MIHLRKAANWLLIIFVLVVFSGYASALIAYNFDLLATNRFTELTWYISLVGFLKETTGLAKETFNICFAFFMLCWAVLAFNTWNTYRFKTGVRIRKIAPGIKIPIAAGSGEYGTADFLPATQYHKAFGVGTFSPTNDTVKWLCEHGNDDVEGKADGEVRDDIQLATSGGLIIKKDKITDTYLYIAEDTHTLTIGATRSSKTRGVSLSSLCLQALAGESMVNLDPKGELYLSTYPFLQRLGYEVIVWDFDNPTKSTQINLLQEIIDYLNNGEVPLAIEKARDIVTNLVQQGRGEPVWTNGERAVLTCAMISVCWDNRERPEYQNMTNVYFFIARMCKSNKDNIIPLSAYLHSIAGEFHPALLTIDVAEISPSKMRSSFYGSALATLEIFNDPRIYSMMSCTEYDIYATHKQKRAIFVILPEEKKTYHRLASLMVTMEYQRLKRASKDNGNRLDRRVNFNLEETGNFAKIEGLQSMLTVGGGAGIRFHLQIQSFAQLDDIYGRDVSHIIRDNCETWIYLQTDNAETLAELSKKLGTYTIQTHSVTISNNTCSSNYSLTGRALLMPEEIKRLKRPWQLITSRELPAVMYAPDISKTVFEKMLGLGTRAYNKKLMISRQQNRRVLTCDYEDMRFVSIEDYFPNGMPLPEETQEAVPDAQEQLPPIKKGQIKVSVRPALANKPVPFTGEILE